MNKVPDNKKSEMGNYNWKEKSDITLGRNLGPMAFSRLFRLSLALLRVSRLFPPPEFPSALWLSPRSPAHLPPHSGLSLALLSARLDPKIRTEPCKRNTVVIKNSPRPGSFHQIASRKDSDRTSCGFGSQAADCIWRIHLTGARARAREFRKRVCHVDAENDTREEERQRGLADEQLLPNLGWSKKLTSRQSELRRRAKRLKSQALGPFGFVKM